MFHHSDIFGYTAELALGRMGGIFRLIGQVVKVNENRMIKIQKLEHLWLVVQGGKRIPELGETIEALTFVPYFDEDLEKVDILDYWIIS